MRGGDDTVALTGVPTVDGCCAYSAIISVVQGRNGRYHTASRKELLSAATSDAKDERAHANVSISSI